MLCLPGGAWYHCAMFGGGMPICRAPGVCNHFVLVSHQDGRRIPGVFCGRVSQAHSSNGCLAQNLAFAFEFGSDYVVVAQRDPNSLCRFPLGPRYGCRVRS